VIRDPLALLAFMFLVVAFARALEGRFKFVEKISSAVVCTLLGIALANIGVIPHDSDIHQGVYNLAVPYAIVLVILSSRLADLKKAGGRLVASYGLAAAGTFIGAFIASLLFYRLLGPETWKLGGTFSGAFVGGGMNFAAVGRGLEMTPSLFAAAFVADNLSTVPWLLTQVGLYTLLGRFYRAHAKADQPTTETKSDEDELRSNPREFWTSTSTNIRDLALLAAMPLGALWLSRGLSPVIPGFPEVLWLTTLALIAAQIPFVQRLKGAAVLSYFALHLFFIVIGATSDVGEVVEAGPAIFLYMILILAIHGLVLYGIGWLARLDLSTLSVASQATVGGPGSALALSMAMKWNNLVTPGIIVGIFGYAIGNYIGFACAYLLRGVL
jgi:uncharacterized membrane protein